ncbi:MAG: DUF4153 domain-containing protein [Alphaproteobacteria bacterium]|nr:DUF4153 domain-containing protein [Alphaproteobacteria bacterium]MBV8410419.1 DUF4153 domain-containing protein [Alphaproteobacteria bacterium]
MFRHIRSFDRLAALRCLIGLVQGVALYGLREVSDVWGSSRPETLWPLVTLAIFIPLLAVVGLGNLRWRWFAVWVAAASAVCVGLAYHIGVQGYWQARWPFWAWTALFIPLLLFVANALVTAAAIDRRPIATYATYFDVAWKQATQLALAMVFVAAFWIVLWLGATLFRAINIEAFADLIGEDWFWIPATTTAIAMGLHLTDAQLGMVRAVRSLLLNLLAWLMPLLVLIGLAFLVALLFTGLAPLWATKVATASLICAAVLLILLINSHFQDGEPHGGASRILVYPRIAGALMLVPLVALAAYGLALRVDQHGLTPSRVLALALVVVLACYAAGYAIAAIGGGAALRGLRATNIVTAFISVAVMLALLTPLADPARLSVADQVGRLLAGRTPLERFDFHFLQRRSGRYGREALARLKAGLGGFDTAKVNELAKDAAGESPPRPPASEASRRTNIKVVRPADAVLPAEFLQADWNAFKQSWRLPSCLTEEDHSCEAFLVDLTGDGVPEILLFDGMHAPVFAKDPQGTWQLVGEVANLHCKGAIEALRSGAFETVPSAFKDIEANGSRWPIMRYCGPW